MTPRLYDDAPAPLEVQEQPTKTYYYDIDAQRIYGFTDKLDAMKQTVYLILLTERYQYLIYSWRYGRELDSLFGKPIPYVLTEIKRRVTEALLTDERIQAVDTWSFETSGSKVLANFAVHTIYGDFNAQKEVLI